MKNYTIEDIEKYINEFRKRKTRLIENREKLLNIPIIGFDLYEKSYQVETQIKIYMEDLEKVRNDTFENQQQFIKKMIPMMKKMRTKNNI